LSRSDYDGRRMGEEQTSTVSVSVVVACAEPFFGEALAAALAVRPPLRVVQRFTDEAEAVAAARDVRPDVVVSGLELGDGSGLSLARQLRDVCHTVLLTSEHEGDVLFDAVEAGAMGCVHHEAGIDTLSHLIGQAARGQFVVTPDRLLDTLKRAHARTARRTAGTSRVERLTAREREVLVLLASGLDNVGIGRRLYLSPQTVRTHVGNILKKLQVHSRAQAVRIALEAGITDGGAEVLHLEGPELGRS
jgi:DNA-binding NarL/FixJ family response regulator